MEQLQVSFSLHPYVEGAARSADIAIRVSLKYFLADTLNHYLESY